MKRSIIVSGAAGFIGSHFVKLHKELMPDVNIIQVDPLGIGSSISRIDTDLPLDKNRLGAVVRHYRFNNVSHIFMFGAMSNVDFCNDNPVSAFEYNVEDVAKTLQVLRNWENKPRVVYISTDEIGGQLAFNGQPWRPENALMCEFDRDRSQPITHSPRNTYSATKAAAEMLVKGMCNQYGIPYAITRCVNNYGHDQGGGKFIPNILEALEKDNPIPIRGSSVLDINEHYRCWVAVEDHCKAVLETGYGAINGEVRHVEGEKLKNIDLVNTLSKQVDKPYKLALKPAREAHDIGYQLYDTTHSDVVDHKKIYSYFKKG